MNNIINCYESDSIEIDSNLIDLDIIETYINQKYDKSSFFIIDNIYFWEYIEGDITYLYLFRIKDLWGLMLIL